MQDVQTQSGRAGLIRLFGLILVKLLSPLVSFALIVAIARMRGGAELGELNTILSWLVIFQFVAIFGMPEFISREIGRDHSTAGKHISHALLCGFGLSLACMGFMAAGAVIFQYPERIRSGLFIAGLALPFGAWGLMCHSVFIAFERIRWLALAAVVECGCLLVLGLTALHLGYGVSALVWALVLARIVGSAIGLCMVHRWLVPIRFKFDRGFLRDVIPRAAVFGLTGVAFQLFMRADIVMLSSMEEMAAVGMYSAASKLTEVCLMLPLGFYVLNLPRAARNYAAEPETALRKVELHTWTLFIPVFFVFGFGFLCADPILCSVYGQDFGEAAWPLRILLLAFVIQCAELVLGMVCQAAGHERFVLCAALVRAFGNIGLNLILIPLYGIQGAALATLGAIAGSFILLQCYVKMRMGGFRWLPHHQTTPPRSHEATERRSDEGPSVPRQLWSGQQGPSVPRQLWSGQR